MELLDQIDRRKSVGPNRRQVAAALALAVATALLLGAILASRFSLFTERAPSAADFAVGRASPETILAPERVTYASNLQTEQAKEQAARAVADVYDPPDSQVAREQVRRLGRLIDFLDTVRADPYASLEDKVEWVAAVPGQLIPKQVISRTLVLEPTSYRQVVSETLYVLDQALREEIRPQDVEAAKARLSTRVSLVLSAEQANLVTDWAEPFIVPNTSLNVQRTAEARSLARDQTEVVYRTLEKGQAVVRAGEVITPETYEALRELGYLQPQSDLQETLAAFLFASLIVGVGALYVSRVSSHLIQEPRTLLILSFLLLATALGIKILVPGRTIVPYLFPFASAAMLGAALVSLRVGTGMAILVTAVVAFIARSSIELTVFALIGSIIAVITLRQRERLTNFMVTGIYVALVNVALVVVFRVLAREEDMANLARLVLAAFGSGVLTGLIALGSQFVLGKLAGITTALELIELSRPTHPLLQRLLREAPGTYHHSLIISNLAEHAAQLIGADSLLCRVGAYYHDVGKLANPQFFVENQFDGVNPHNVLDPRASCQILFQHSTEGVALAKKYGVSKRVRDLIPQHHGTTLAVYFYEKAVAASPGSHVAEHEFRYPGPKPQSREAAIMMLADGVEAATRAERPTNADEIRVVVDRIIEQRVRDGQLDEVEITLRDLELIKQAFLEVLQGLYHPRVKYPAPMRRDNVPLSARDAEVTVRSKLS